MAIKKEKRIQVTFMLEEKTVQLIDHYGEKIDRSRSQMIRNLVNSALDEAKVMNAIGVFDIIKLKNWFERGRQQKLPLAE